MRVSRMATIVVAILLLAGSGTFAQVERVWLTNSTNDTGRLMVNWTTKQPGNSIVHYGLTSQYGQSAESDAEATTLHHVEIKIPAKDVIYHYSVASGHHSSSDATFKGNPTGELRVAIIANWQGNADLSSILKDDVHILLTAGDNVSNLWARCGSGQKECILPYADLVDRHSELFRSIPIMPTLGNHDREIRPRGDKPPLDPVYDIDATAFRRFFPLPDEGWKWSYEIPDFDLHFLALDLSHISDLGTTWQTSHSYLANSPQYLSYRRQMTGNTCGFVVTLYNEKNSTIRDKEQREWHKMISRGTLAVSGFGYFAERAEVDGFAYYNTSLNGRGDRYPDPKSKFFASVDSYVLLRLRRGTGRMTADLKSLDGNVLDRIEYTAPPAKKMSPAQ
jgi:hypothetical protein